MLCRDVMSRNLFVCGGEDTAARCAQIMKERNIGFLPVVDADGKAIGVLTDRDLVLRVLALGRGSDMPARAIMTRDLAVCRPDDALLVAEEKMAFSRKSRLLVVDGEGRCVGVVSLADVAQADSGGRVGKVLRAVTRREASRRPAAP